jgi:group I intron endonuclease
MIIYRIFNRSNGKSYIGQSVNSFNKRYKSNKWWKYTHNELLKNSIKKYGVESFDFEIIEEKVETIEKLNKLEMYYAEKFNSYKPFGYNIRGCGENRFVDDDLKNHLSSFRIGTSYKPKNKIISKYKGVYWRESKKSWMCRFDNKIIKKTKYCSSETEAAETFDKVCLYLIGEDCFINFEEKRKYYLSINLEDFYLNSFLPLKVKRKDGYYKDLSDLRDKILPLINLSISEISNNLNITKSRINWCIKKYKLK